MLFRSLFFLLLKENIDIVHAQHVGAAVTSLLPAKITRTPLIYEKHSFWKAEVELIGRKKSPAYYHDKFGEKLVVKTAESIITLSEKMNEALKNWGASEERLHIVYPAVDMELFDSRNARDIEIEGVNKEDFIFMYAGNFSAWQGLDTLLEAVPIVANRLSDVKFVLVGGSKQEIKEKKKKIQKHQDKVVFLGKKDYELMPSFLERSDVLVIPKPDSPVSWATPRKLGEYLAMGKRVVATDVGDFRKIIAERGCGVVTGSDPESLAGGLVRIFNEESSRTESEGNARRTARTFFDGEKVKKRVLEIYEETC